MFGMVKANLSRFGQNLPTRTLHWTNLDEHETIEAMKERLEEVEQQNADTKKQLSSLTLKFKLLAVWLVALMAFVLQQRIFTSNVAVGKDLELP